MLLCSIVAIPLVRGRYARNWEREPTVRCIPVKTVAFALRVAVCSSLGSKEYALKVAPVNKNKRKNQAAIMISHEGMIQRIRLNAFMKNYNGSCPFTRFTPRSVPLSAIQNAGQRPNHRKNKR